MVIKRDPQKNSNVGPNPLAEIDCSDRGTKNMAISKVMRRLNTYIKNVSFSPEKTHGRPPKTFEQSSEWLNTPLCKQHSAQETVKRKNYGVIEL